MECCKDDELDAAKCNHAMWGEMPQTELWNRVISIFWSVRCNLEWSLSNWSLTEDYLLLSNLASSLGACLISRIKDSNRPIIKGQKQEKFIALVFNLCIIKS